MLLCLMLLRDRSSPCYSSPGTGSSLGRSTSTDCKVGELDHRQAESSGNYNLPVFWSILRVDTLIVDVIEHQAVSAAQLLGCGGELTDDVLSAGSWVREGWVS